MDKLNYKARAKINLGLDVCRRLENGYHEVKMVMQTVDIYDELEFKKRNDPDIILSVNSRDYLGDLENNLIFKAAKDRGAEQYRNLTLDSELTPKEMITMYRIITGACRQGSESFVSSLGELKDKYTVREAIEITKGQYNAVAFEKFFEE